MGDIVVMREDGLVPMRWPIARVIKTIAGNDGSIVTVKKRANVMCSLALLFDRQNFKHCAFVFHSLPPSLITIQLFLSCKDLRSGLAVMFILIRKWCV